MYVNMHVEETVGRIRKLQSARLPGQIKNLIHFMKTEGLFCTNTEQFLHNCPLPAEYILKALCNLIF